MPEGHTIHRYARQHRKALTGHRVVSDSPQGRFAQGSAAVDGRPLVGVDGYGKHLFYRFAEGVSVHVHLGLFGQFRSFAVGRAPTAGAGVRWRLAGNGTVLHLSGPSACELVDPDAEEALLARLGPDPLRPGAAPEVAWQALQRRRRPIGHALLDQRVVAGVGNVFRAEVLFRAGIHPARPAGAVAREEFDALWADLVALLRAGARSGRIVTVEPSEVGASRRARVPADERVYVYRRAGEPCRRCGTPITAWSLGGRTMYACPACQPA